MIHTKTLSMKPIDLYLDFYRLNNQFHNGCVVMVFIRIVTNNKNPPSEILDSRGISRFFACVSVCIFLGSEKTCIKQVLLK